MLKRQVKLGGIYYATVSNRRVSVRIENENCFGGWNATNLETGRAIRIRSGGRLTLKPDDRKAVR